MYKLHQILYTMNLNRAHVSIRVYARIYNDIHIYINRLKNASFNISLWNNSWKKKILRIFVLTKSTVKIISRALFILITNPNVIFTSKHHYIYLWWRKYNILACIKIFTQVIPFTIFCKWPQVVSGVWSS